MTNALRVFVASSSEQIKTANAVATALGRHKELEVHPWDEGVFDFSSAYIESLENELERADFAVVVLTADDASNVRDETVNLPRDNVIFELGLFTGRLGRDRCFFFVDGDSDTKIASDLSGVKLVKFYRDAKIAADTRKRSLETQAEAVMQQILDRGVRYKPSREVRQLQDRLWRFSTRLSGHWWERMRSGEDDMSALSFVTVSIDPTTNTPTMNGRSYDTAGGRLAEWKTISTGVVLGDKPKVYYRWEGEIEDAHGQAYGGGGHIVFDDQRLETGEGYYYDTNFALLPEGALTRVKHFGMYRCTLEETEVMKQPWSEEALSLLQDKLTTLSGR
jgi:hypothetical protein